MTTDINKDIELQYQNGRRDLIEALETSDLERAKWLVKNGAYIKPQDIHYTIPFWQAANITQVAIMSLISDASDNIVNNMKNMVKAFQAPVKEPHSPRGIEIDYTQSDDILLNGELRLSEQPEQPFTMELNGITMTIPKEVLIKAVIDYLQKTNN